MSVMRTICILILLIFSQAGFAADRDEMVRYFIELEDIESVADKMIVKMRDELIGSDKKITNANFAETYGDLFEDYRDAYITANIRACDVYSDQQINDLYEFYQSDFGKWYRQEETAFGPRLRELMDGANKVLRSGVAGKRNGKRKSRK